ncbi:MAG: hypothetical protein ACKPCP_13300, partial [Sphaerospermopsis kisseleviana]
MPRTTKKLIEPNSVGVTDFCQTQGINEQLFRLELMQFMSDADTTKIVPFEVARTVAGTLSATKPALPQSQESPETPATQAIQPATESAPNQPQKPQNTDIVPKTPSTPIAQVQEQKPLPTALAELITASQETIELADL